MICTQRGRETSAEKKSERQVLEHRKQITGETEDKKQGKAWKNEEERKNEADKRKKIKIENDN